MPTRFDGTGFTPGGDSAAGAPSFILVLDRAIASARFVTSERVVLQMVREACGATLDDCTGDEGPVWPEWLSCRLNLTELARATGILRMILSTARWELIASKVLIEDEAYGLRINDQVGEWIHPSSGRPRLTAKLLEFCRAADLDSDRDRKEAS